MFKRAVEHADSKGVVGNDFAAVPDHAAPRSPGDCLGIAPIVPSALPGRLFFQEA